MPVVTLTPKNDDVLKLIIPEYFRELVLGKLFLGKYLEYGSEIVICAGRVVHWGQLGYGDKVRAVRQKEVCRGEACSILMFSKIYSF